MKEPIYFPERDNGTGADCCLNLYTACDLRCTFCDLKERRHKTNMTREEFAESTECRKHIIRGLAWQLAKWRVDGEESHNILLGALGDPYPVGCDTTVTREAIQMIHEHGHSVTVLTKNPQKRDFDVLKEKDMYGIVLSTQGEFAKAFEPLAPSASARIFALYDAWIKAKCGTMIVMDPLIDPRFAESIIEHTDVDRYVVVEARGELPLRGRVDWDKLKELAEAKGRVFAAVRNPVYERKEI